jgi:hypothetical protein
LDSVIAPDLYIFANSMHQIAWEERER